MMKRVRSIERTFERSLKHRKATRVGSNAEIVVKDMLERSGYCVDRDRTRPGYDLMAAKGKKLLIVQVKTLTDQERKRRFSLTQKELAIMLNESESPDGHGFSSDIVPCIAVVMRKYLGHAARSKTLVVFFTGRAYSTRASMLDYDFYVR